MRHAATRHVYRYLSTRWRVAPCFVVTMLTSGHRLRTVETTQASQQPVAPSERERYALGRPTRYGLGLSRSRPPYGLCACGTPARRVGSQFGLARGTCEMKILEW